MRCEECERLQSLVLDVNLEYINADSELMYFANRTTISADDGDRYKELIERVAKARAAYDDLHRRFVDHKLKEHGDAHFVRG